MIRWMLREERSCVAVFGAHEYGKRQLHAARTADDCQRWMRISLQRPGNASAPFITGNPVTGAKISCSPGVWRNDPTSFAYRWLRDGTPIGGATAKTYKLVKADKGHQVACRVTASNPPYDFP